MTTSKLKLDIIIVLQDATVTLSKQPKEMTMKVFFLGAYSDKGREGMMSSSYDARVKAVSAMVEKAGAKLGSVDYLRSIRCHC